MGASRVVPDYFIAAGRSWEQITGRRLPDHHIARILTFLRSTSGEDLVSVKYYGPEGLFDEMGDIYERLVFIGEDGAGTELRRKKFEVTVDELSRDFDAIYLCQSLRADASGVRYVVLDIGSEDFDRKDATLVCRRDEFSTVYEHLEIGGSGTGLWRGAVREDPSTILSLDEAEYVFGDQLVADLVRETVDFLRGDVAARLRAWKVPAKRGILLFGPPGNGKTVLTRLCAKHVLEAGMTVVIIEGRRRSRMSFDRASMGVGDELRRAAARGPALLVLEDIDLHCKRRQGSLSADVVGQHEENPALAEILDFLDGFDKTEGYVLLASTNYVDRLDPALRRTGRIDREISIDFPPATQRVQALQRFLGSGPSPPPNPTQVAELLDGASFADLAEVVKRYKLIAAWNADLRLHEVLETATHAFMRERTLITTVDAPE